MGLLIGIGALLALIWGVNFALRASVPVACAVYLVLAGAVGYDYFHFDAAGISLSLDRVLLIAMFGAFLVQGKLNPRPAIAIDRTEWVMFGFFALLIGNTIWFGTSSDDPMQVPIVQHLIEGYGIPLMLYWIGRRSLLTKSSIDQIYAVLALFGIYLAFTAICEIAGVWAFVFPKVIRDPSVGIHFGRARGPFLQSVRLGMYLFIGLAAIWIPLVWRGIWGPKGQLVGLMLTPLVLGGILATLTRSIWLGTGIGAIILLMVTLAGRPRRAVIVFMVASILAGAVVVGGGMTSFKREYGAKETQESTNMRVVFAYVSWLMVKDRPVSGFGFGHFPHKNRDYLNDRQTHLNLDSIRGYIHHNTFLSLWVELGVFGITLYVALMFGWMRQSWQFWSNRRMPDWMRGQALILLLYIPFYVVQMLFHDVSYSPMENGLMFLLAGLTMGLCFRHQGAPVTQRPMLHARRAVGTA